jgi:hypothetical protein
VHLLISLVLGAGFGLVAGRHEQAGHADGAGVSHVSALGWVAPIGFVGTPMVYLADTVVPHGTPPAEQSRPPTPGKRELMISTEREWVLREFDPFPDLSDDEVMAIGTAAPMSTPPTGQRLDSLLSDSCIATRVAEFLGTALVDITEQGRAVTTGGYRAGQVPT